MAFSDDSDDRSDLAKILVKRDGHLILLQTNNANEHIFNRFIREGHKPTANDLQIHSDHNISDAIKDCQKFVDDWTKTRNIGSLMSLVLHRLGFVVHDTEDQRAVYTVFEVLNSRGLEVDWLDKSKSMLMGRAFELAGSSHSAEAEIHGLQNIWGEIYREIAKENVPGQEILRVTATLHFGAGAGKPRSSEDSLLQLRAHCNAPNKPRQASEWLLDYARKLVALHGDSYLGPVTQILHARVLAVAIMSAKGVNENERKKLLEQWERVTFRIFGLNGKDSRHMVGKYVRLAARIVGEDIEARTYNQIMTELKLLGTDYPVDDAVKEGLAEKACYEISPDMCRYVLWQYEEYLAAKLGPGATVDEHDRTAIWRKRATDSIEHIFPQNPRNEPGWNRKMKRKNEEPEDFDLHVHRIGNLMLLPVALNSESRTKPFNDKKSIYAKHSLRMVSDVCKESDWTLDEIDSREKSIIDWATTRWADL